MLYLWIGIMAGLLIAYLWMRTTPYYSGPRTLWWRSNTNWLSIVLAFALLIPLVSDLWVGLFRPISVIKTIVLPWTTGIGFGIWLYLIFFPRAKRILEQQSNTVLPQLITIATAMLVVALILSDERYNWFSRLQKLSFGGGGVELAPSSSTFAGPLLANSAAQSVGGSGKDRISFLLKTLQGLPEMIERDVNYANEVGYSIRSERNYYVFDKEFAMKFVVPLATRLLKIHDLRGYNEISFVVDRPLVDNFRSFVRRRPKTLEEADQLVGRLSELWSRTCELYRDLIANNRAEGPDCEKERDTAIAHFKAILAVHDNHTASLTRQLPYGVVLSSLLLNAAGEVDAAVEDLNGWIAEVGEFADSGTLIGVYRARAFAVLLLQNDSPTGARLYQLMRSYQLEIALGKRILASTSSVYGGHSWFDQTRTFLEPGPLGGLWHEGKCAAQLTNHFALFILANMTIANNFANYLSENYLYARQKRLEEWMEKQGRELADVNLGCLQRFKPLKDLHQLKAAFLDTVAAVEMALATHADGREAVRTNLCAAQTHIRSGLRFWTLATSSPATDNVEDEQTATQMRLLEREERIQSLIAQTGTNCP